MPVLMYFFHQSFQNYLQSNGGEFILLEQRKLNRLNVKTENKLIRKMIEFTFDRYTLYPTELQALLVCKAALELVDGLKGGLVSVFLIHTYNVYISLFYCQIHSFDSYFFIAIVSIVRCKEQKRCFFQWNFKSTSKAAKNCRSKFPFEFNN